MSRTLGFVLMCILLALVLVVPLSAQPEPLSPEVGELAAGNNAFAFDLYQALIAESGTDNLFYSPYSISLALAMTYAGADGQTKAQMADVLHFALPPETLHPAFAELNHEFARRSEQELTEGDEEQRFRLNIANAIWAQQDYNFVPDFVELLNINYGAGLQLVDYMADPEAARDQINAWVEDQTEDRIQDLVPEGVITVDTRLVLANAIYFKAAWLREFMPEATQDGPFTLLDGSTVEVPLMTQQEGFLYGAGEGYQAVMMPYYGGQTAMVVLLPEAGAFEDFQSTLTADSFAEIVAGMGAQEVALTFPRFEFESAMQLADYLQAMGMVDAFTGDADFGLMRAERDVFISAVVHKAFVAVDEAGTEAAAATAVVMEAMAAPAPQEVVEMRVDRPFMFAIYDLPTNTILFMGQVTNPAS
ncbi:MAG: serpin family protein [bacterium]|nr:serpin family protein [bacterium]